MDLDELRLLVRKSLKARLREYASKRRRPIDKFSDFVLEVSRALENSGLSKSLEESISSGGDHFDLIHEAWTNIEVEMRYADPGSEKEVWNDSTEYYIKNAIQEIASSEGLDEARSEFISNKVALLLRR